MKKVHFHGSRRNTKLGKEPITNGRNSRRSRQIERSPSNGPFRRALEELDQKLILRHGKLGYYATLEGVPKSRLTGYYINSIHVMWFHPNACRAELQLRMKEAEEARLLWLAELERVRGATSSTVDVLVEGTGHGLDYRQQPSKAIRKLRSEKRRLARAMHLIYEVSLERFWLAQQRATEAFRPTWA